MTGNNRRNISYFPSSLLIIYSTYFYFVTFERLLVESIVDINPSELLCRI